MGGPLRTKVAAYATGFYRKRSGDPLRYLVVPRVFAATVDRPTRGRPERKDGAVIPKDRDPSRRV